MTYDLKPVKAPVLKGRMLRTVAGLAEAPLIGRAVRWELLRNVGIRRLRRAEVLTVDDPLQHWRPDLTDLWGEGLPAAGDLPLNRLAEEYREGTRRPSDVIDELLAELEVDASDPTGIHATVSILNDTARISAGESDSRFAAGTPIGPLDGIPVAIKDEMDVLGVATNVGTSFIAGITGLADSDGTSVARLKAAGAVIFAKTTMHELGIGVFGINPHHGIVRNPRDPSRMSGGSSSGSAAIVSAGTCSLALGADGGGSIRIPAALCGVLGLKATHGRISEHGAAPLCPSVGHIGPIGASVADVAVGLAVMAGPDANDAYTLVQPRLDFSHLDDLDLRGVRIGVFQQWFEHAQPDVVRRCREGLDLLVDAGASIIDVEIPSLDEVRIAHLVTITTEMLSSQSVWYRRNRRRYGGDTRVNLALASGLRPTDKEKARQIRHRVIEQTCELFEGIELLATPSTACTAPPIPDGAAAAGLSDIGVLSELMRYAQLSNLTGQPSISIPVGADSNGLPVGLQLMASP